MTSRRAARRRSAIVGELAERGRVHPDVIAEALHRNPIRVINDLLALERDGRVIGDRGVDLARRRWRLATDAGSGLTETDADWAYRTFREVFGDEP